MTFCADSRKSKLFLLLSKNLKIGSNIHPVKRNRSVGTYNKLNSLLIIEYKSISSSFSLW